jgi:hypothetical protein
MTKTMWTAPLSNDQGIVTGFQIRNGLFGRFRAARLAAKVPGAQITRGPRGLHEDRDAFCAFAIEGVPFLIIEPFNDNSHLWVVAEEPDPAHEPLIARLRATFR